MTVLRILSQTVSFVHVQSDLLIVNRNIFCASGSTRVSSCILWRWMLKIILLLLAQEFFFLTFVIVVSFYTVIMQNIVCNFLSFLLIYREARLFFLKHPPCCLTLLHFVSEFYCSPAPPSQNDVSECQLILNEQSTTNRFPQWTLFL